MEQDTTCPYCNERPMVKRKNAATCGDATCQRKRNNERVSREYMREYMRAKRAANPDHGKVVDANSAAVEFYGTNGDGTGRDIWESMVKPRRETPRSLVSQALLSLALTDRLPMDGSEATADWPCLKSRRYMVMSPSVMFRAAVSRTIQT